MGGKKEGKGLNEMMMVDGGQEEGMNEPTFKLKEGRSAGFRSDVPNPRSLEGRISACRTEKGPSKEEKKGKEREQKLHVLP